MWWTWVWVKSGSWWWTGKPGVLQSMGSQSQTRLGDWTERHSFWHLTTTTKSWRLGERRHFLWIHWHIARLLGSFHFKRQTCGGQLRGWGLSPGHMEGGSCTDSPQGIGDNSSPWAGRVQETVNPGLALGPSDGCSLLCCLLPLLGPQPSLGIFCCLFSHSVVFDYLRPHEL